jgi:nucleoside-diphosphate-sugar epimerase
MSPSPGRLLYVGDALAGPRRLRDTGHEVVVLDPGVSADALVAIVVQEDVDLVAVTDADLGAAAVGSLDDHVVVFWVTPASGPSQPPESRD